MENQGTFIVLRGDGNHKINKKNITFVNQYIINYQYFKYVNKINKDFLLK